MKKRYLIVAIIMGILLLCGGGIGYDIFRESNQEKEMAQQAAEQRIVFIGDVGYNIFCESNQEKEMILRMEEQKIIFMCERVSYSGTYTSSGYLIDDNGDKYFFDVTDEFRKRPATERDNDNLYDYLCEHMVEYERVPFLQKDQLYECYANLNLIDKDAEMVGEQVMHDGYREFLEGVRLSEGGEPEFIRLAETGDWQGYNSDEYAQRIVESIGADTWMDYKNE